MENLERLLTEKSKPFYIPAAKIDECHPTHLGRHDLYAAAVVMVTERHEKYEMVDLVSALLHMIHDDKEKLILHQAGECYLHTVEVGGSNPLPPTIQENQSLTPKNQSTESVIEPLRIP